VAGPALELGDLFVHVGPTHDACVAPRRSLISSEVSETTTLSMALSSLEISRSTGGNEGSSAIGRQ
jgi:hypothetical protein